MSAPHVDRWIAAQDQILTALESPHLGGPSGTAIGALRQSIVINNTRYNTQMTNALQVMDQVAALDELQRAEAGIDFLYAEMQPMSAARAISMRSRNQVADGRQQALAELNEGMTATWQTFQEAVTEAWLTRYANLRLGPAIKRKMDRSNNTGWNSIRRLRDARTSMYPLISHSEYWGD